MCKIDITNINNKMLDAGVRLMEMIDSMGDYQTVIVGGTPRDILLGFKISDVDIATNCPMEVLSEKFQTYDIGRSKDFGIVVIYWDGFHFEVAQFRSDNSYSNNRHPDSVNIVGDFYTDSSRRDFTCNALGLTKEGVIIDYHGGIEDIKKGIIRAVGNPYKRFAEDRLRMVRMARFMAATGFKADPKTRRAARRYNKFITTIANERIRMELIKAAKLGSIKFAKFIDNLRYLRLLYYTLPEVDKLRYFIQKKSHHPEGRTVYDHVIKSVEACRSNDPLILIAVLLHDIGKGETMTEVNGYPKYISHDVVGAKLVQTLGERLCFSNHEIETLVFTTEHHMRFHTIRKMRPSKIVKLASSQHWEALKEVGYADEACRGINFDFAGMFDVQVARAEKLREEWVRRMPPRTTHFVDGATIMEITDEKPGKIIGQLKNIVHDRIIDEEINQTSKELINKLVMEEYAKLKA